MGKQKTEDHSDKDDQNSTERETIIESKNLKTAFFITPLGSDNSEIRRSTDGLIDAVIRPVLKENNIYLVPPHEIKNPGTITRQIVRHILTADLVIANLTGLNPNVMYELAIRHAKRKPIIIIAENGTKIPFDLVGERIIFYQNDMAGVIALASLLSQTVPVALEDEHPENPIYNGLESLIIQQEVKAENDPIQSYIIEKLEQLSDSVAILRNNFISKQDKPVRTKSEETAYTRFEYTLEFVDNWPNTTPFTKSMTDILSAFNPETYERCFFPGSNGYLKSVAAIFIVPDLENELSLLLSRHGYRVKSVTSNRLTG